ncbi:hypothetical protein JD292_08205 [Leucobacter sp. CSA2]|uniref:Bacterial Ig-like domain-containing protein n=1 Tax=Leucobacter edaphi TaxID=2796472 RepID=A0A934QCD9_9MICO|nr:Ig-like domain-containing protein [Leucobacter edaphi]MBK0422055.1 hypothetical protein [Leucobacter edaphi]
MHVRPSGAGLTAPGRRRRGRLGRWTVRIVVAALAATGLIADVALDGGQEAHAAAVEAPEVFSVQSYNSRTDDLIDELRVSLVLKVPHGYVDPNTGNLQQVNGKYLRVGFDNNADNRSERALVTSLPYLNTFGAIGADRWARSIGEHFTVHKVIEAGDNDLLVISMEGNLTVARHQENNLTGGRPLRGNLYFTFDQSPFASTTDPLWIRSALTAHTLDFNVFSSTRLPKSVVGPIVQMQYAHTYELWSAGQGNLGQVLDYGLAGNPAGVLPANSVPVDVTNFAYVSPTKGPANSVSNSFWFAWVHEDGTLVTDINTAPIRVTGIPPHSGYTAHLAVKNIPVPVGMPTLAYTPQAAAQGLTKKVSTTGTIDFREAGGTGFYRMLVWPETSNPTIVDSDFGAPTKRYSAADLVDGNVVKPDAMKESWTAGSAFYRYTIKRPDAPVITVPQAGAKLRENKNVVFSGTGLPGHSITLSLMQGSLLVPGTKDPALMTLVDGERNCKKTSCDVVVQPDGTWSYTYTPSQPLADDNYTVVATQTEQMSGGQLTSDQSNPNHPTAPTAWGVPFEIDTQAPAAPLFPCPATTTKDRRPTLSGSGIEAGASVQVYLGDKVLGKAVVTGDKWTFTPEDDLPAGAHRLTVTQLDRAGNESAHSAPPCALTVLTDIEIVGAKTVLGVTHPAPGLTIADADNWEVIVSHQGIDEVISGKDAVKLERGVRYLVDERLRTSPEPDATALMYAPRNAPVCVDSQGDALPEKNYDPLKSELFFSETDVVAGPVKCEIENQAHQATLVTKRLGGQTVSASAGWTLRAEPSVRAPREAGSPEDSPRSIGSAVTPRVLPPRPGFRLSADGPDAVVRPGAYSLDFDVPEGLSKVGIDLLDLDDPECAAYATNALQAPESCWDTSHIVSASLQPGAHEVFRIVAADTVDLPSLPLTGGLGSWLFSLGGAGALALAAAGLIRRRILRFRGEHPAQVLSHSIAS